MMNPVKIINRKNDLKQGYLIRLELGFIATLLIFIMGAKLTIKPSENNNVVMFDSKEDVHIEEITQTRQIETPPPRPPIPVEVPNDEIIEDEVINLDAELDFGSQMDLPPPPQYLEEKEDEEEVFVVVEQMPELIGGLQSVQHRIRYPEMAVKAGIEGRVVVQFVIDLDGNVQDPKVVRGIGGGCDEEAVKAVKEAKFVPGRQRGKPVLVRYSLPISFTLNKSS